MSTHRIGRRYEALAARYLEARGWRVLARNWRDGPRELDLVVARDEESYRWPNTGTGW